MARRMRIARVSDLSVDDLPSPLVVLVRPDFLATGYHVSRKRCARGFFSGYAAASPSFGSGPASADGRTRAARRGRSGSVGCMLRRGHRSLEGIAAIEQKRRQQHPLGGNPSEEASEPSLCLDRDLSRHGPGRAVLHAALQDGPDAMGGGEGGLKAAGGTYEGGDVRHSGSESRLSPQQVGIQGIESRAGAGHAGRWRAAGAMRSAGSDPGTEDTTKTCRGSSRGWRRRRCDGSGGMTTGETCLMCGGVKPIPRALRIR